MFGVVEGSDWTLVIPSHWVVGVIGSALGFLVLAVVSAGFRWAWPWIVATWQAKRRLRRAEHAVRANSRGVWLAPSIPKRPPADYQRLMAKSIPIILVANLKGGVGKTTTVANLIGHYGLKKNKRVLAIDLDFQGSLSETILTEADYRESLELQADGNPSKAAILIDGRDGTWLVNSTIAVDGVESARCIPAYYSLAAAENRAMVEWLIATRSDDLRYRLALTLLSKEVQDRFDLVLIDAPPRLTTACVQGLAAATHVLLPTVLDDLSATGTGGFTEQLVTNQDLWPHLQLLGVFGNMTSNLTAGLDGAERADPLADYEADALATTNDAMLTALENARYPLRKQGQAMRFPVTTFIPRKAELGRQAGHKIIYKLAGGSAATQEVSRAYDRLGDEIDRRLSSIS